MARGISNWVYKDVKKFLSYHGYQHFKMTEGSHEQWLSPCESFIVDVNRTKGSYPERTLESMIQDCEPRLDKKHWKKWAQNEKKCCGGLKIKE